MTRRVREGRVRHRLVALVDRQGRDVPSWVDVRSTEFKAGYAEGLRVARQMIRKG
ncbi:hypothetical protein [Actinokineospora sp. UTMC 2448]|uniref:hypothetical protein n=1 Tax=Actinokineospora sp. UTMC 2448 TaxID=2268449 RepID=UPI0021641669|nr:hypothetical protein [Actinokineospora sp. UTMC 2448]UVS78382.1 hypothetical protein Actkin_02115 [Actinokineospora sp. UTMC 2448]